MQRFSDANSLRKHHRVSSRKTAPWMSCICAIGGSIKTKRTAMKYKAGIYGHPNARPLRDEMPVEGLTLNSILRS